MMKSALKFVLPMMVALGFSAAAQAATGNWNGFMNGPNIYQTNWYYESGTADPPSYVPSSAKTTSVSWKIKLSYYPSGTQTWLHFNSSGYLQLLPGSISGYQTLTGVSATETMSFTFLVSQSTTKLLSPYVTGGGHQLNINYQY